MWWKNGIIYQIYPRSFYDSNDDGIGDIPGIIKKLDYLKDLGVSGIWLSPINTSPMYDFGYDISDYRNIDPVFGTRNDIDTLVREAHARDIRIIMDMVLNHSSHLHPWFLESAASRDNPKSDWYIWHDGVNGKPPNNWLGIFGGKAWQWNSNRAQFYLHTFLKEQPDLNWRNPETKNALLAEMKFWLDKGVDGFRFDVLNWFIKDKQLRSNPPRLGPSIRPYDLQNHIHDKNQPETYDITKEIRKILDSYEQTTSVGEIYSDAPGDPELSASFVGEDLLHMAFDFSLIYIKWNAELFHNRISRWYEALGDGKWPCLVLSNHDKPRTRSRLGRDSLEKSCLAALLLLTLRGTPFIYYGEELGMTDGCIKKKQIIDPIGKKYWPFNKGRDACRTPMQWSPDTHAGFSNADPWLPVHQNSSTVNVEQESRDQSSLLNLYKRLIAFRKNHPVLQTGKWKSLSDGKNGILGYERVPASPYPESPEHDPPPGKGKQEKPIIILLNFTKEKKPFSCPRNGKVIFTVNGGASGSGFSETQQNVQGGIINLSPYEGMVIEGE